MGVEDIKGNMLQFDNMSNRPIKGSTNWNCYSIVLDAPQKSAVISFGIVLIGQGIVWVNQFVFEEVIKLFLQLINRSKSNSGVIIFFS